MDNFLFWRTWPKSYALLFKIILGLFVLLAVSSMVMQDLGRELTYEWEILNRIQPVRIPLENIEIGLINYAIEGVNYLNIQEFEGSETKIYPIGAIFFAILFFVGISLALVSTAYLSRFWFYVAMAVFIFLTVLFKLENLELFGTSDKTGLIVTLFLFITPTYYFHAFKATASLLIRILVMTAAALVFILLLTFFSPLEQPLLAFAGFGLIPAILISVIFIFMVAHDIVSFFMYLITNNNNEYSKSSDVHFVVITLIYLALLLFTYLYNITVIEWQLVSINPFIILLFSAFWGLWEFRHRRINYENIIPFSPYGAIYYLAMGVVCFATLNYFLATANDPVIETFEDAVIFSHLGFGLAFFIYVLANFFTILHYNRKVYKTLYKPTRMPYFTARLAGLIAVLAFFFQSNKIGYSQARAGIYNAIGDYYRYTGNTRLTKEYYELGGIYGFNNHRSNYSLGHIYRNEGDETNAVYYFDRATRKQPTPYAYVNLSAVYNENGNFFQSLFALQDGIDEFQENGPIANNLAMHYNKTSVYDSILHYINIAEASGAAHEAATSNLLGFYAQKNLGLSADTLLSLYENHNHVVSRTHLLLLMNERNYRLHLLPPPFLSAEAALTVNQYAYLQNFLTNQLGRLEDDALNRLDTLVRNSGDFFEESLVAAQALLAYQKNDIYRAMDLLQSLKNAHPDRESYYAKLLAAIALDQHAPQLALEYLSGPEKDSVKQTLTALARLMAGAGKDIQADSAQDNRLVNQMYIAAAAAAPGDVLSENDTIKFNYLILNAKTLAPGDFNSIFSTIANPDIQAVLLKRLTAASLESADPEQAEAYLSRLSSMENLSGAMRGFIASAKLRVAYFNGEFETLFSALGEPGPKLSQHPDLALYQALYDEKEGRIDDASSKYEMLATSNPFFEEGILRASDFFKQTGNDIKGYNTLLEALNYNKYSTRLLKAYIISAAESGLAEYAKDGLDQLRQRVASEEFSRFKDRYDSLLQTLSQPWQ